MQTFCAEASGPSTGRLIVQGTDAWPSLRRLQTAALEGGQRSEREAVRPARNMVALMSACWRGRTPRFGSFPFLWLIAVSSNTEHPVTWRLSAVTASALPTHCPHKIDGGLLLACGGRMFCARSGASSADARISMIALQAVCLVRRRCSFVTPAGSVEAQRVR
jgi:hypothetical protein